MRSSFIVAATTAKNVANYNQIRGITSATTAVTKIHRLIYSRVYPVIVVQPDGSSINIRYHEPRKIIQLPLNLNELSEDERKKRIEARRPRTVVKIEEDLEDSFNAKKYLKYVKK